MLTGNQNSGQMYALLGVLVVEFARCVATKQLCNVKTCAFTSQAAKSDSQGVGQCLQPVDQGKKVGLLP